MLRVEDDDEDEDEDEDARGRPFLDLLPFLTATVLLLELQLEVCNKLGECPTSTFSIPHSDSSIFLFLPPFEEPASLLNDRVDDEDCTGGKNNADAGIGVPLVRDS